MSSKGKTTKPPPIKGYNRTRRIACRGLLGVSAFGLATEGYSYIAVICSSLALLLLKQGTFFSIKNLKWISVSFLTLWIAMWSCICLENAELFGKGTLSALWGVTGRTPELIWGTCLGLLVASSIMTNHKQSIDQAQVQLVHQAETIQANLTTHHQHKKQHQIQHQQQPQQQPQVQRPQTAPLHMPTAPTAPPMPPPQKLEDALPLPPAMPPAMNPDYVKFKSKTTAVKLT